MAFSAMTGVPTINSGCSAYAYHREGAVLVLYLTCVEVDIGECIQFVDYNVDVIGADAMGQAHYGLALIGAADGVEFP